MILLKSHLLWFFSLVTLPSTEARRQPWSIPNIFQPRLVHRPNVHAFNTTTTSSTTTHHNISTILINDDIHSAPSATSISAASAEVATATVSEYVVVCVLGIDGSTNSSESGCILVEMIPSDKLIATQQQQRYHYYPNIFKNFTTSGDALSILYHGVGLLADVIIIHMGSSGDADKTSDSNILTRTLVMGLRQRHNAHLTPTLIYIVASDDAAISCDDRAEWIRNELRNATTTEMVRGIEIVHGYRQDRNISSNDATVDILVPVPKANGTQTLTECSSFIYVLQETFRRLQYNSSNLEKTLQSFIDIEGSDVNIIDSIPSTTVTSDNMNETLLSEENGGFETNHPPGIFPKSSFGIRPSWSHIGMKRLLTIMLQRTVAARSDVRKVHESYDDDQMLDLDRIHETLRDIHNQQEDYVLSSIDSQSNAVFDLVPMMNPIVEQLHNVFVVNQDMTSDSLSLRFDPIIEQIVTIYSYQCNTILRNYYGSMYETIFDQQRPQPLNARWIHSLQERMKGHYRRDLRLVLRPLERYDDIFIIFSKIQQRQSNSLDIETFVTSLMSDLQDITELRIDVSDMDHGDVMHDLIHPTQYRNRLRRERFYQYSKTLLKRAVMLGINYIQGYIAIQSIKHIALQQEREMPKFPLF